MSWPNYFHEYDYIMPDDCVWIDTCIMKITCSCHQYSQIISLLIFVSFLSKIDVWLDSWQHWLRTHVLFFDCSNKNQHSSLHFILIWRCLHVTLTDIIKWTCPYNCIGCDIIHKSRAQTLVWLEMLIRSRVPDFICFLFGGLIHFAICFLSHQS